MMSFSGHPVCHLGLICCILLGLFLLFDTKIGNFGNTGLFDQVLTAFKCYQYKIVSMHLGHILTFYKVYK